MAHQHENKPVNPDSLKQGYEVGEMGFKVILIFGLIISGATILSMIAMVFFFGALQRYAPSTSQYVPSPMAAEKMLMPSGSAPVEARPVIDRLVVETGAKQNLHEFAWISKDAGIARIPIEDAITMIVDRGTLPRLEPIESVLGPQTPAASQTVPGAPTLPSQGLSPDAAGVTPPASERPAPTPRDSHKTAAPTAGQE